MAQRVLARILAHLIDDRQDNGPLINAFSDDRIFKIDAFFQFKRTQMQRAKYNCHRIRSTILKSNKTFKWHVSGLSDNIRVYP